MADENEHKCNEEKEMGELNHSWNKGGQEENLVVDGDRLYIERGHQSIFYPKLQKS